VVADFADFCTIQVVDGLGELLGVVGVTGVAGQVHDQAVVVGLDDVRGAWSTEPVRQHTVADHRSDASN
jgi:hypothetical protein